MIERILSLLISDFGTVKQDDTFNTRALKDRQQNLTRDQEQLKRT